MDMLMVLGACCVGLVFACLLLARKNKLYQRDLALSSQIVVDYAKDNVTLTKELNHRVKNTLQLFQSLLNLERRRAGIKEPELRLFRAFHARLKALALISNDLYQDGLPHRVDLADLLQSITASSEFLQDQEAPVQLNLESWVTDLDTASAVGLIVCEILLMLATHEEESLSCLKAIRISLTGLDDGVVLNVEGDSRGVQTPDSEDSVGRTIVAALVAQLEARLEVSSSGEHRTPCFKITLPRSVIDLGG